MEERGEIFAGESGENNRRKENLKEIRRKHIINNHKQALRKIIAKSFICDAKILLRIGNQLKLRKQILNPSLTWPNNKIIIKTLGVVSYLLLKINF